MWTVILALASINALVLALLFRGGKGMRTLRAINRTGERRRTDRDA